MTNNVTVAFEKDISEIKEALASDQVTKAIVKKLGGCFFKLNELIYTHDLQLFDSLELLLTEVDTRDSNLITHYHDNKFNYALFSNDLVNLLKLFDGEATLISIFRNFLCEDSNYYLVKLDLSVQSGNVDFCLKEFRSSRKSVVFVELVTCIFKLGLISLVNIELKSCFDGDFVRDIYAPSSNSGNKNKTLFQGHFHSLLVPRDIPHGLDILLVGSTPGTASVGILYLASYLKQNGINAACQLSNYCLEPNSLKNNIKKLIKTTNPKIVGVSLKWFPHIARGLEICKLIKEYSQDIKIVLGGNTAAFYSDELIKHNYVDYIILGDGEVPLLKLCQNEKEEEIPNIVYKVHDSVVMNDIGYVQDKNTSEICLSHLADTIIDKEDLLFNPFIYIYTGKGCNMNCFYCAGCNATQKKIFNRNHPFVRNYKDVRIDILAVRKYVSGFLFDFDLPNYDTQEYYEKIWDGIDLSNHFCTFYFWKLPQADFLALVAKTFKCVFINMDLCSLSEGHRLQLASLKLVKPQPTDKQMFEFLDTCEKHKNVKLKINLIAGLPFFTVDDIKISEQMINCLLNSYSCFIGLEWGRLHAQPGASLPDVCEKFGMYSTARTFEEYLNYSKKNLLTEPYYPDIFSLNYPFIFFNDENLNMEITIHYLEIAELISKKIPGNTIH